MTKEGWKHLNVEMIQDILDDPGILDHEESDLFIDSFYKYFDWYWANQRSK